MKILLLGDASNYHYTLGTGLRRLGHDVTVASNGSRWMNTRRDIDLSRRSGKLGGAMLWLRLNTVLAGRLKGYDVVQLVNPSFVGQRPNRLTTLFSRLKRDNGAVFLTALGTDMAYVETLLSHDNPLMFSEWAVDGQPTPFAESAAGRHLAQWLHEPLRSLAQTVYDNVDGVVSALYEYHVVMRRYVGADRLTYGGIPVDVENIPFIPYAPHDGRLKVLAPYHEGRELEKGTDILRALALQGPAIDLQPVTGLPFDEFVKRLSDCDAVLDQYYAHTPATTALMAMCMGKAVVTGASPQFERFVGEPVPAINVSPHDHDTMLRFLADPTSAEFADIGARARSFVERHNSAEVVAARFLSAWGNPPAL